MGRPRNGQMSPSTTFRAGLGECSETMNFWIGQKTGKFARKGARRRPRDPGRPMGGGAFEI